MTNEDKDRRYSTYAFGKFSSASTALALGLGDIKQRLHEASDIIWAVSPEALPEEARINFIWIKKQLMRYTPTASEGEVLATIKMIRKSTCQKIAKRILLIESLLRDHTIAAPTQNSEITKQKLTIKLDTNIPAIKPIKPSKSSKTHQN